MKKNNIEEINNLKEEINFFKTVINELRELNLYKFTLEYDWDENPYELYQLFDIDEFIDEIKNQKQLTNSK